MTLKCKGPLSQSVRCFFEKHLELVEWIGIKIELSPLSEESSCVIVDSDNRVVAVGANQCFRFLRAKLKELEEFKRRRTEFLTRIAVGAKT